MVVNLSARSEVTLDDVFEEFEDGSGATLSNLQLTVSDLITQYGADAVVDFVILNGTIKVKIAHTASGSDSDTVPVMDSLENDLDHADNYSLADLKSRVQSLNSRR